MAIGITICLTAYWLAPALFSGPAETDVANRLAYAGRWLLAPGLALFFGIVCTANLRFFDQEAIDGNRKPETKLLEVNLRYNQNTLEQAVLAVIAWLGLAITLPTEKLSIIPVMALLFFIGRILFFAGYLFSPVGRAVGFGLTFYPTIAAFVWLLLQAFQLANS